MFRHCNDPYNDGSTSPATAAAAFAAAACGAGTAACGAGSATATAAPAPSNGTKPANSRTRRHDGDLPMRTPPSDVPRARRDALRSRSRFNLSHGGARPLRPTRFSRGAYRPQGSTKLENVTRKILKFLSWLGFEAHRGPRAPSRLACGGVAVPALGF